jgi:hypothetical protein
MDSSNGFSAGGTRREFVLNLAAGDGSKRSTWKIHGTFLTTS